MTALADRVLRAGGPALLFENPQATPARWPTCSARPSAWPAPWGGQHCRAAPFGELLASLKARGTKGFKEMVGMGSLLKTCGTWRPRAQQPTLPGTGVEGAGRGPGAPAHPALLAGQRRAPLVTWGLVITTQAAQDAAEPGHLPPAGAGPQPAHHALAGTPRRALDFAEHCHTCTRQPYPVAVPLGPTRRPSWAP